MKHKETIENKKFSCKNCGAILTFEPGADGLRCSHCGALNEIDTVDDFEIIEEDFEAMLADLSKNNENRITVHQTKCSSCSAISTLPKNVTSASCPFCGSNVVIDNASLATILKPKYLIPFKISKEQAEEIYRNWANKLYSAPRSIKNKSSTKNLTGIYIPYWTFDSQTETAYRGEQIEESKSMGNKQIRSGWKKVYGDISLFLTTYLLRHQDLCPNQ